jgi:tRNA/rRNA methyltransferase
MQQAPAIILVRPQMAENIGAAARAMMNCGLMEMRLVAPRDGWPEKATNRAYATASGAEAVLDNVQIFETLAAATADLHFTFATTARDRYQPREVFTPTAAAESIHARNAEGQKVGLIFGPERTGLENADLMLANASITIPLNPEYTSLNLAQAVLLVAWEWRRVGDTTAAVQMPMNPATRPAEQKEVDYLLGRLLGELDNAGFFTTPEQKPTMQFNLMAMFKRTALTEQEVRTLHGIITALKSQEQPPRPKAPPDNLP